MKFYSYYQKPPKVETVLDYETTFVSQAEADTCSLSYQLNRFGMDGLQARMEAMRDKFGYADCTVSNSFADIQNRVRQGIEYFEALPSEVRRKYNDNPEEFYDYLNKNPQKAVEDGFFDPATFVAPKTTPLDDVNTNQNTTDDTVSSSGQSSEQSAL